VEIYVEEMDDATVVTLNGEIDGQTSGEVQDAVLPLVTSGSRILLDMIGVSFMSSAGLRTLLLIYRSITGSDGQVVLVGLSNELQDTMDTTGFLEHFLLANTIDEGYAALNSGDM
jgi:anti-sigma B factor antagonist